MTGQVYYLDRTCMDCGKEFLAVIEKKSNHPLNCWYWGGVQLNHRNTWFIKYDSEKWKPEYEDGKPGWQRWLKENLPAYCYPDEEVTVKSIWRRWFLLLRGWLDRAPEVEMWTCPECVEVEEKRTLDTCPEEEEI